MPSISPIAMYVKAGWPGPSGRRNLLNGLRPSLVTGLKHSKNLFLLFLFFNLVLLDSMRVWIRMNWGGGGCKDSAGCLFTENVRVKDSEKTKKKTKKKC
jgi:hypothetical protein